MLHQPADQFVPTRPALAAASAADIERAKAWIAAARKCGLVVYPSRSSTGHEGITSVGQDEEGRNEFSAANLRFAHHPASACYRALPKGLVFEVLCGDYGVDPDDPDLMAKVVVGVAAEAEERKRITAERKLLALCKRAEVLLHEDQEAFSTLSKLTDSYEALPQPDRPDMGPFPASYGSFSHAEAREKLRELRATPKDRVPNWQLGLLASGRFKQMVDEKKAHEAQVHALKKSHGLLAAEAATERTSARARAIVAEIAALAATTPDGLAAKCRLMKIVSGWGIQPDGEYEDLTGSIFDDGARLVDLPRPKTPRAARPSRSGTAQPAHH